MTASPRHIYAPPHGRQGWMRWVMMDFLRWDTSYTVDVRMLRDKFWKPVLRQHPDTLFDLLSVDKPSSYWLEQYVWERPACATKAQPGEALLDDIFQKA